MYVQESSFTTGTWAHVRGKKFRLHQLQEAGAAFLCEASDVLE